MGERPKSHTDLIHLVAQAASHAAAENSVMDDEWWKAVAVGVLAGIVTARLAVVPQDSEPKILAAGWGAINAGREQPVHMGPGSALREAWPKMVEAVDLARREAT